ncbi:aprataxin and PNK-like factor [Condylostylus longicornis]|uniref:aprataxin and PNK-like factor n=1 Tax=Condylostylus longicornis TaxID=2530218 RepID=UPI00244E25E5|nr:aprataxin and PNK-like factor [Condylostylus longicornis]
MLGQGKEVEELGKKRKIPNWLSCNEDLAKRKKESYPSENFSQNEPEKPSPSESISLDKVEINIKKEKIVEEICSNAVDEKLIIKTEKCSFSENYNNSSGNQIADVIVKLEPDSTNNSESVVCSKATQMIIPNASENESSFTNKIIKTESADDTGNNLDISSNATRSNDVSDAAINAVVKNEPQANTSQRISCKFGIKCYRQNPVHRVEEAHPGDLDYRRPEYPEPPKGTPICPYGNFCYRRNPVHFQQFSHPDQSNSKQNNLDHKERLRDKKPVLYMAVYPDENSSSDDFSAGSEDEFDPAGYQESDEGVDVKDQDTEDSEDM